MFDKVNDKMNHCMSFLSHHHQLESLHEAHKGQVSSNPLFMMEMVERVKHNVDWSQRYYHDVITWLQHRGYTTSLPSYHDPSASHRAHG